MNWKYLLVILFLVLAGALVFLVVRLKLFDGASVTLNSDLHEVNITFTDTSEVTRELLDANVVDDKNIKKVNVLLTKKLDNPMFVQQDTDGKEIISSGLIVGKDGVAHITIAMSDFVQSMDDFDQVILVNYYFWEAANIAAIGNAGGKGETILSEDRPKIFMVEK